MRPLDVQQVGEELAIRWDDNRETFIPLRTLRERCPCAACLGEMDMLGRIAGGGARPESAAGWRLVRVSVVGGYALQPVWGDGHQSGLYTFDLLRRLGS
jgi:DUF971 family protein